MLKKNVFMEEAGNGEQGAGTAGAAAGGEEVPSWFYNAPGEENAGVAGSGEVPDWFMVDKYKSVDEQAKAYPELAKRFGGFEAAPEDYAMPEGYEETPMDDGLLDIVKAFGKEHQMGQGAFNELVSKATEYQMQQSEQSMAKALETLGENAEARISNVNDWLNVNAPKEIVEMIIPMANSAESIQALEFLISKTKGSKVADNNAQQTEKPSQAEYSNMLMAKDAGGNLRISTDPEYKAKIDKLTLEMQG